ncbi:Acyl-CoA synthetase (AMP-forming)/AMP-acid ligase II [Sphingobium faniae]|nr:Acyl-CoA synthetase (AMP-forming)/AMP-acid ligase II [Sphingobium faniae]
MSDAPLYQHPSEVARDHPGKAAIIMADSGATVDYATLVAQANRVGHLFEKAGVKEGETVAFLLGNSTRYPELIWGAKDSGIRYVCISTHLNPDDAAYIVRDSGAKLLVADHGLKDLSQLVVERLENKPVLYMLGGSTCDFADLDAILPTFPGHRIAGARRRGPSMLYSSGTTGRPKGVKTILPDAPPEEPPQRFAMLRAQYGLGDDSVFLNPGPFYHAAPNRFMMSVLRAGGTIVAFEKFAPEPVLRAIQDYRVTHGFFVPTMFGRMSALPDDIRCQVDTGSLRHAIHAAAPCSIALKRRMIEWWGPVIDELYAGTEAFGHSFINSAEWLDHPGSVGRPAANCRIKIVDEQGRALAPGQVGRIMMSNGLRISYHDDAAKSDLLYDDDGFASLGDIGYLDEAGFLYLTDRESHMIIVGGVNIYPQEVENILIEHELIEDVAVIGVPDEDMGEQVRAVVQLRAGIGRQPGMEQEIIQFCRNRLSLYKCPKSVDFMEQLPRSPMGKLLKRELRQRYWADRAHMI